MPSASNRFREELRRSAGYTKPPRAPHLQPKPPEKWRWRAIAKVFGKRAVCRVRGHTTFSAYYVRGVETATNVGAMCDYCGYLGPTVKLQGSRPGRRPLRGRYNEPMPEDRRRGILETIKQRLSPWNP